MARRIPTDLREYLRDQREICALLDAELLFVESPEVAEATLVEGVEIRPGDQLRSRLRL